MYGILKKILFSVDPEAAHQIIKKVASIVPSSVFRLGRPNKISQALKTTVNGITYNSPIGLAAGFDKNAEMVTWLQELGFGFIEIGSVTASPCIGNPKPRIFRLPIDDSLINRMGLPNLGCEEVALNLRKLSKKIPIGINIAKTPQLNGSKLFQGSGIDDYLTSFSKLKNDGDFFVLNLSCPNTNDGKTFEDPQYFSELIQVIDQTNAGKKQIFIKLSPDLEPATHKTLVEIGLKHKVAGFVLSNTTRSREGLLTNTKKVTDIGAGGLSGRGLQHRALELLKKTRLITGSKVTLIACGGIMSFNDLIDRLVAGATLVEVYTGFIYSGPFFVSTLNRSLDQFCQKHKLKSYQEIIGNQSFSRHR